MSRDDKNLNLPRRSVIDSGIIKANKKDKKIKKIKEQIKLMNQNIKSKT